MLLPLVLFICLQQICLCGKLSNGAGDLDAAVVLPAEIVFNEDDISQNGGVPENPRKVWVYDYYTIVGETGDIYDDDLAEFLKQLDYPQEYDYYNNDGTHEASNLVDRLMSESAVVDDLKVRFQRDDIPRPAGPALEVVEGGLKDPPVTLGSKLADVDAKDDSSSESNSTEDDSNENESNEDDDKHDIVAVLPVDGEELVYYYDYAQLDKGELNAVELLTQDMKNSIDSEAEEGYFVFEGTMDEDPFKPVVDSGDLKEGWSPVMEGEDTKESLESMFLGEFGQEYRLLELSFYIGMFIGVLLLVFGWLVCIIRLVRVRTQLVQQQAGEQLNEQKKTVKLAGIVKSYARLPVEIRNMKPSNIAYKELYNNA